MTEADVVKIRSGHWPSDSAAAADLGVRLKSVYFARRGITWRSVKSPPPHPASSPCGPDPYEHRSLGRTGGG